MFLRIIGISELEVSGSPVRWEKLRAQQADHAPGAVVCPLKTRGGTWNEPQEVRLLSSSDQERDEFAHEGHVASDEEVSSGTCALGREGPGWIQWVEILHRFDSFGRLERRRQDVGRLLGAGLSAVDYALDAHAAAREMRGQSLDVGAALFTERPIEVHVFR
jgi:hypothetical protein